MSHNLNIDDFILGDPIDTQIGSVRFLKFSEYIRFNKELNLMSMKPLHLYYQYKKQFAEVPNGERTEIDISLERLKKQTLHELILEDSSLRDVYKLIFSKVLTLNDGIEIDDIFEIENIFTSLRTLILDMNYIVEDTVSDNPEIQKYYEDRKKIKQKENGKQTVSDIITSIVAGTSNSFAEVKDMTAIQVYSLYYRVSAFKNFDASILFATVSSDVKIESWSANIDLFKKDELGIGYSEFSNKYGGLFN